MHAVERLAPPRREQPGDRLVGGDHQLLDEAVRGRLRFLPRTRDAAAPVEGERDLRALDPERTAREAPFANGRGETVGEIEGRGHLGLRLAPLGLCVCQPGTAADDGAIEAWLAVRR